MVNEELAIRAKAGDAAALMELWESVRRLCFRIAGRYENMLSWAGYTNEDTEQTLFLAFYAALVAFEPSSGNKFTSYLQYPVMNVIRAALDIRDGKKLPPVPVSLDEPIGETNDGDTRGSLVPDPDAKQAFENAETRIWNERLHDALEQCLDTLEEKQAEAVRGTYYKGLTAAEVGECLGISASQATQLKQSGLRKLRHGKNLQRLKQYREEIDAGICRGVSLSAWKYGGSVEEKAVLRLDELENPTSTFEPKT